MLRQGVMLKEGGANLPAPPSLRPLELEELFAPARLDYDYLSFLLDGLEWERQWGTRGGLEALERMLNKELDRWGLDESQELWLAAILAERHGLELPEPQ